MTRHGQWKRRNERRSCDCLQRLATHQLEEYGRCMRELWLHCPMSLPSSIESSMLGPLKQIDAKAQNPNGMKK